MCSFYSAPPAESYKDYGLEAPSNYERSFAVRISNLQPIITRNSPLKIVMAKWGLVPSYSKEPTVKFSTHNARKDRLLESPVFRTPFQKYHCLVLASHFYEYRDNGDKTKTRFVIHPTDRNYFSFAGMYSIWKDVEGKEFPTYTFITTEPGPTIAKVHDREAVMLTKENEMEWLNMEHTEQEFLDMLVPYPEDKKEIYEAKIPKLKYDYDGPDLVAPKVEETSSQQSLI